jgi:ATP-dependent protease Clp ATPase subunit
MFIIPSQPDIRKVVVDEDAIKGHSKPQLMDVQGELLAFESEQNLSDAA